MSKVVAAAVFSKQRYVAMCQLVLLVAAVAALMIATTRVTRLDIVGSPTSSPANQPVHSQPLPR